MYLNCDNYADKVVKKSMFKFLKFWRVYIFFYLEQFKFKIILFKVINVIFFEVFSVHE